MIVRETLLLTLLAGPLSAAPFDHREWASVLDRVVDQQGQVDYAALRADHQALDRYLGQLAASGPQNTPELFPDRNSQLAYYINAYNAFVFAGVLDLDADASTVWGVTGTGYGFFARQKFELDGAELSLKSLEDDIVRARFADPRIHAALNCASMGCPRLPQAPFTGPDLDRQLDAAMREFLASDKGLTIDRGAKQIVLSKIFDWFAEDFLAHARKSGKENPTILEAIAEWREEPFPSGCEVRYAEYDKRLNAQP